MVDLKIKLFLAPVEMVMKRIGVYICMLEVIHIYRQFGKCFLHFLLIKFYLIPLIVPCLVLKESHDRGSTSTLFVFNKKKRDISNQGDNQNNLTKCRRHDTQKQQKRRKKYIGHF